MADPIVVMHDGIIEQIVIPLEPHDRPGNLFVAQLIASPSMNGVAGALLMPRDGMHLSPAGESIAATVMLG